MMNRRWILLGAGASAAGISMPAPHSSTITALADQIVEQLELGQLGWSRLLNKLINSQARSIDELRAKTMVWEAGADAEIDDIAFDDLQGSIACDLLNWEIA